MICDLRARHFTVYFGADRLSQLLQINNTDSADLVQC